LRERAAGAAAEADMVILSLHAASELPVQGQAWIEEWTVQRDHQKCALVALLSGVEGREAETQHLLAMLQRVARQAHLDFFPHTNPSRAVAETSPSCCLAERAAAVTPTLLGILHQRIPAPREGLRQP